MTKNTGEICTTKCLVYIIIPNASSMSRIFSIVYRKFTESGKNLQVCEQAKNTFCIVGFLAQKKQCSYKGDNLTSNMQRSEHE